MNSAIERLLTLRVSDVMNSPVVMVPDHITMGEAARLLTSNDVSGVPVVNVHGRCVGVLSAADFAERAFRGASLQSLDSQDSATVKTTGDTIPAVAAVDDTLVADHMSPLVQTVGVASPIMNAARIMCREHIHRLIIVDDDQRPIGVVSSLDLVAAMVAAIEE